MVSRMDRIAASLLAQREEVLRRLARPIEEVLAERRPARPMPVSPSTLEDELLDLRNDLQAMTDRVTALADEAYLLTGADAAGA